MSEQGKVNINSKSINSGVQCTPRAARMYTQLRFCLLEGRQRATGIVQEETQLSTWIGQVLTGIQVLTPAHLFCLSQRLSRNTSSGAHQCSDKWVEASFFRKAKHFCPPCQQVPHTWEHCQQQNDAPHKPPWFLKEGTEGWPCNDMDICCSGPCQELSNSFISCLCTKGSSIHWPEAWQGFRALT